MAKVKVLDATWYLPNMNRDAASEFRSEGRIQNAKFFDLDGISDTTVDLPHMLPTELGFSAAADALGISKEDHIVVYDRQGIFSSPRAWWTWKVFGHEKVSVLDGGLPAWIASGGALETSLVAREELERPAAECLRPSKTSYRYKAHLQGQHVRSLKQIMDSVVARKQEYVVDARPAPRFDGKAEEPRAGLAKGHIPGSKNIPWDAVLTAEGTMKSPSEIEEIFRSVGIPFDAATDFSKIIASCGSGTTACILVLASEQVPGKMGTMSVYDGSWSEYGAAEGVPVQVS